MTTDATKATYRAIVEKPALDLASLHNLATQLKAAPQPELALQLSAQLMRAALVPATLPATYDAVVAGWLDESAPTRKAPLAGTAPTLSPEFWAHFWRVVGAGGTLGAKGITEAVVALSALVGVQALASNESAALSYAGVKEAVQHPSLPILDIHTLASSPAGSLGAAFYRLILDNGFDVEVLQREQLALTSLPIALRYTNTRILQTHDLWHLVAGYDTTALHEVGITAFQLAQFGHSYSAMFLPVTVASVATNAPPGLPIFLDTIADGWRHGRTTPPMLLVPWEQLWSQSIEEIRARYGIAPFPRRWPANLIEIARGQAAA